MSDEIIYCRLCGAVPGAQTTCAISDMGASIHNFTRFKGRVFCRNCGKVPGTASKCSVSDLGASIHVWEELPS